MKEQFLFFLKKYIVVILPVIFFITALVIHFSRGKFYLAYVDPEYFHLFNGLNLSIFNLAIDYIHHPGTTIQIIFAISAHFVNFIQPGFDLIANAMNDPEQFIHGANILLNLLTSTSLFILGVYTYKISGNIFYSLLLQLMPYSNFMILLISGRLIPEAALVAPLLFLVLLLVRFIYDNEPQNNMKRYVIGFAIVGGLGMAGKFLYFPFLIIPIFLIPTLKWKLKYLAYTTIAIVVFAFPVFVHLDKSVEWFGNMFMHSGKWGSGESNFIDISTASDNLKALFVMDKSFFILCGIAGVQLIVFFGLFYLKKKQSLNVTLKVLLGLLVSIALSIFLVTKHFAPHYFYPTLVFKAFLIYLMTALFVESFPSKRVSIILPVVGFAIGLVLASQQIKPMLNAIQHLKQEAGIFENRRLVLKPYNTIDNPLIITSHYSGSPFIESAMVAGVLMSGSLKSTYIEKLAELHPNTYFYYDWSYDFYFWDQFKNAREFIDLQKPVYIFIGEGMEAGLEVILERLKKAFPDHQLDINILHHFTDPDEYFYEITLVEKLLL